MAIEEDKLPAVMPVSVPRVKTNDGTPTTFLIDWEESTRNWYRTNAVALDARITEVKATADNASAAVVVETNARITADGALADQITTVSADFDQFSANGEIYFGAAAGPSGTAAAYSVFLNADDSQAGMQIIAKSGGGGAIGFLADQFVFTDSGTMQNVFDYSGGQFVFTGNVAIDGNLLVSGTVSTGKVTNSAITTEKVLDNAVTNVGTGESADAGDAASAPIFARSGDRIVVWATYAPDGASGGATPIIGRIRLNGNTGTQKEVVVPNRLSSFNVNSGGDVVDQVYQAETVTRTFIFIAPSTGTHTVSGTGVFSTICSLVCMSLSK